MIRGLLAVAVAVVLGTASGIALGGTINFAGLVDDAGVSGTTEFGIDGYDLFSTSPVGSYTQTHDYSAFSAGTRIQSLPTYISSITANGASQSAAGYGYATIINPANGQQVQSGHTQSGGNSNTEESLLDINVGSSVPSVFYIGAMNDAAGPTDNFDAVRLRTAGGADSGLITALGNNNMGVDFYFFKVAGASPGDIITLSGVELQPNPSSGTYFLCVPALTFSQTNPVPEPSTLALLGVGMIGLVGWGLRKRIKRVACIMVLFCIVCFAGVVGVKANPIQWSSAGGNNHWYEAVYVPAGISWMDAKTAAESKGGYLASITSDAENEFVFSLVSTNTDFWSQGSNSLFYGPILGGYQYDKLAEPAGHWRWTTDETWEYTNWSNFIASQPDNFGGADYLVFGGSPGSNGVPSYPVWDDNGGIFKGYIVESVPEPSTLALLGVSMIGLLGWAWRKRKSR